jgi:hypothetical protein
MDNRWGDFELPAKEGLIGARVQKLWYVDDTGTGKTGYWPGQQIAGWSQVTCTYGPFFKKMGPFPAEIDHDELGALLALRMHAVYDRLQFGNKVYDWQPWSYSNLRGIEGDPGHQGYHGLKGEISDDFIGLGHLTFTATDSAYLPEAGGSGYYLWTTVRAEHCERARIKMGQMQPGKAWLNGHLIDLRDPEVQLEAGINTLLLFYPKAGKTHFVLESPLTPEPWQQSYPLAMTWFGKPGFFFFEFLVFC